MSSIRFLGVSTSTFFIGPMGPGWGECFRGVTQVPPGPDLPLTQQDRNGTRGLRDRQGVSSTEPLRVPTPGHRV